MVVVCSGVKRSLLLLRVEGHFHELAVVSLGAPLFLELGLGHRRQLGVELVALSADAIAGTG
jgi:hypothetical protein